VKALLIVCALAASATAQPTTGTIIMRADAPPVVSVLTFGQGEPLFEKWGHAALCLQYPTGDPICFNWGVTDFAATPQLVWGFLRGEQVFWLEAEAKSTMIAFYEVEDRDVWEQTLALSPEQARDVETRVLAQLDGPWRYYIYDHFFDNCTTRIRDIVDRATHGALSNDSERAYPLTFRELGYRGLAEQPLLRGLADFLVGRTLDRKPTMWEAMFHPDVLRHELYEKLGATPRLLARRTGPPFPQTGASGRLMMFAIALVFAVPLALARWRKRFQRAALAWATVWLAGWGIVIWTAIAISGIAGIRYNEVALVLVPFDLVLPFSSEAHRRRYARVRVIGLLLVSMLCSIGVLHQPMWVPVLSALMPLALLS
jgi:Domain of unknown function (DUF4105)